MDKSQLRRLALDFAHGNLDAEEYRRQRARLLDHLESGEAAIDREPPLDLDPTLPSSLESTAPRSPPAPPPQPAPATRTLPSPLHLGVGAATLVLVALLVTWLFSGGEPEPPPRATTTTSTPVAPAVPPARELVEAFVAEKDFSENNLARFRARWSALAPGEVEAARGTPWFRRMVTAVVQEVKTQKALGDLDGTGRSLERALRLVEFGRFLGISDGLLPAVNEPAGATDLPVQSAAITQQADTPVPERAGPSTSVVIEPNPPAAVPLADMPALATLPEPDASAALPVAPLPPAPQGRDWLQSQPPEAYTLQLYALNHLEKVENLIARHPELALRLVDYTPDEPRYRVFLGRYDTPDAARAAHAALPDDVRSDQPTAFVRPIGELVQGDAATTPPVDSPAPAADVASEPLPAITPAPTAQTTATKLAAIDSGWLSEQPSERYTLQLFASNSRDNAERLMTRFPELALALHESADAQARFRVLYGSFSSAEEARRAFGSLPGTLAKSAGSALVKPIGELQQSATRAN